jgi:hypothetical protein
MKIIVNGKGFEIYVNSLLYLEILALAGYLQKDIFYTVTYRNGCAGHPEGSLVPGDMIDVKDGMIFNVSVTGSA